ncbi:hypothetical protein, partial [Pararhodobacter sp.]|uniref:hypothetical protein n=1 Tax=Pararhodobacter sp. TaxID=2127056 RepID=UPI002AFEEE36
SMIGFFCASRAISISVLKLMVFLFLSVFWAREPPGQGRRYSLCSIFFLISQHRIGRGTTEQHGFFAGPLAAKQEIPA